MSQPPPTNGSTVNGADLYRSTRKRTFVSTQVHPTTSSLPLHYSSPRHNSNVPDRHHPTFPPQRTPLSMYEHHHHHHRGQNKINITASGLPQRILPRQQLPSFGVFLNRHLSTSDSNNPTAKTSGDVSVGVKGFSSAQHSQTPGSGFQPPLHSEHIVHRPHLARQEKKQAVNQSGNLPSSDEAGESKRRERWTDEEHERFLAGLETFGRKWKKIQTYVQSKTAVQVRTHAYGYFAKLLRNMPEHVRILETSATDELSTVDGIISEHARHEVREVGRRGLEILHKHVLSKRKPGLSVEEKRRRLLLKSAVSIGSQPVILHSRHHSSSMNAHQKPQPPAGILIETSPPPQGRIKP